MFLLYFSFHSVWNINEDPNKCNQSLTTESTKAVGAIITTFSLMLLRIQSLPLSDRPSVYRPIMTKPTNTSNAVVRLSQWKWWFGTTYMHFFPWMTGIILIYYCNILWPVDTLWWHPISPVIQRRRQSTGTLESVIGGHGKQDDLYCGVNVKGMAP